jgi:hypothetical protein
MSGVFQNIDPHPSPPGECVPPRLWCGGGVNILEDARHCLYSTYESTLWLNCSLVEAGGDICELLPEPGLRVAVRDVHEGGRGHLLNSVYTRSHTKDVLYATRHRRQNCHRFQRHQWQICHRYQRHWRQICHRCCLQWEQLSNC